MRSEKAHSNLGGTAQNMRPLLLGRGFFIFYGLIKHYIMTVNVTAQKLSVLSTMASCNEGFSSVNDGLPLMTAGVSGRTE